MNKLVIPPSPNWFQSSILACSSDNTLLYGSRQDLVVVNPPIADEAADIRIFPYAHAQKVLSVAVNKNWGQPNKYCVTTSDDKVVCLWDISEYKLKGNHINHVIHDEKVVGANFAGEEKVVSIAENGRIVIWHINTKEEVIIKDLFGPKAVVSSLSVCPHASWLAGFGMKNGLVVVVDLRKSGKVLHKLRGHDKSVISLSWCPIPINIFPKHPKNTVKNSNQLTTSKTSSANENTNTEEINEDQCGVNDVKASNEEQATTKECEDSTTPESNICQKDENKNLQVMENDSVILTESAIDQTKNEKDLQVEDGKPHTDSQKDEAAAVEIFIIEPVEEKARKEFLLASSGQEGNIYIWRAGTDGRMQTFFSAGSGFKKSRNRNDKIWITVNWITPNWLLSSSTDGSLLKWILPRPLERISKPFFIHKDHRGDLYSIAGPCKFYSGDGWDNDEETAVWTSGHDRLLLNTGINVERKNLANYPTFGGSVCSLVASPITPTRLALGLTDGTIRVWELGQPHTVHIEMTCFYQKVHSKVTSLSWHPSKEFLLGYGTIEGRIGILDTSNPSKPPKLLPQYFKSTVHKIEWGPLCGGNMENVGLYATAEWKIVIFNEKTEKDVETVLPLENLFAYNFAWKPDYTMLLVSTRSGELLIYTADLKLSRTVYLQQKGLSNIAWHPFGKPGDIDSDSSACWFAVTIPNNHNVYIYDLSKLCKGEDNNSQPELILEGHFEIVSCLAWDCLQGDKLVAAGEDGIAQVWNTVTNTLVASYVEPHFESVCSIMWSPLDSNHVISCSKNGTLVIWNPHEHPPINKKDLMAKRKKHLQSSAKGKVTVALPKAEQPAPDTTKPNKQCRNVLFPLHSLHQVSASKHCSNMRKLLKWVESKNSNSEACLSEDSESAAVDCLKIFGSKEQIYELLTKNEEFYQKKKKRNLTVVSSLFKGDIAEHIKQAIEQKAVTQQMIALAPMVSTKVWQDACQTYAEQLNESQDSDPMDTAMYYLACHKVQEAIDCLCSKDLYKEALALAKCRFPEDDSLIPEILRRWAKYAFLEGDFETSALCRIVVREYEEAAKSLFRRSNQTLEIAVELAELSGNKDLEEAVRARYELFKPDFEHKELLPKSVVVMGDKVDSSEDKVNAQECEQNTIEINACGNRVDDSCTQKLIKDETQNRLEENTELVEDEVVALENGNSGISGCEFTNGHAKKSDVNKELSNESNGELILMKNANENCTKLTEKCEHIEESVEN